MKSNSNFTGYDLAEDLIEATPKREDAHSSISFQNETERELNHSCEHFDRDANPSQSPEPENLNLDAVNKIYCTVMNQVDLWKLKTLMTFPRPNSNLPYGVTKIVEAFVELNQGVDIEVIKSQIYQKLIIATINFDTAGQAQK